LRWEKKPLKSEILPDITSQIIEKATEFGASLAGIADVEAVKIAKKIVVEGQDGPGELTNG